MNIKSIKDISFAVYGNVKDKKDFEDIYNRLRSIPNTKEVVYVGSEELLEESSAKAYIEELEFGTMPMQIGYCNGKNKKLNALEFHKSSEIIVAGTDLILVLGKISDIKDNTYDTSNVEIFKMLAGEVVEIYATTLHYCPISIEDESFSAAILLPKHTNDSLLQPVSGLFARNKWLYGHEESFDLNSNELAGRLIGENIEIIGGADV